MTLTLLLSLAGIAVLDSFNPSLFVAQFYLFTTPRPVLRIAVYIVGIWTVNYGGGLLILSGVRAVVATWLDTLSPTTLYSLQLAIGIAALIFGLWYSTQPDDPGESKKLRSLGLLAAYGFGMTIMVNEISTAMPYFVALERLAQAALPLAQTLLILAIYNLIFSLPLWIFLGLFVAYRARFSAQIESINQWMQKWTPRLVKYAAIAFGLLLILNAGLYLLTGTALLS